MRDNPRKRKLEEKDIVPSLHRNKRRKINVTGKNIESNSNEEVLYSVMKRCHSTPELFGNEVIFENIVSCLPRRDIVCVLLRINRSFNRAIRNSRRIGFLLLTEYNDAMLKAERSATTLQELPDFNNGQHVCVHAKIGHACALHVTLIRGGDRYIPCLPANMQTWSVSHIMNLMQDRYRNNLMKLPIFGSPVWEGLKRIVPLQCIGLFETLQPWYTHFKPSVHHIRSFAHLGSVTLDRVEKEVWNFVKVSMEGPNNEFLLSVTETPTESLRPRLLSVDDVVRDFEDQFHFDVWAPLLEWKHFFIAGGSLLSSVTDQLDLRAAADIDIWCYGLSFSEWRRRVLAFLRRFVYETIQETEVWVQDPFSMYMNMNGRYKGWVIDIEFSSRRTKFMLQFIWRGKYHNIASILHCFDIGAAQIGLTRTEVGEYSLVASSAFLYWAKSGYTIPYGLRTSCRITEMHRIYKYIVKKNVIGWQLPKSCELGLFSGVLQKIANSKSIVELIRKQKEDTETEDEQILETNVDDFRIVNELLGLVRQKFARVCY